MGHVIQTNMDEFSLLDYLQKSVKQGNSMLAQQKYVLFSLKLVNGQAFSVPFATGRRIIYT